MGPTPLHRCFKFFHSTCYSPVTPATKSSLELAPLPPINQINSGGFDEPAGQGSPLYRAVSCRTEQKRAEQTSPLYQAKPAIGNVMPQQSATKTVDVSNSFISDVPVRRSTRVRHQKKIYETEREKYVVKDTYTGLYSVVQTSVKGYTNLFS